MNKVEVSIHGQRALVDEDQVKKVLKKQDLASRAMVLQNRMKKDPALTPLIQPEMNKIMSQIIRLNRTIRQNVQFIKD